MRRSGWIIYYLSFLKKKNINEYNVIFSDEFQCQPKRKTIRAWWSKCGNNFDKEIIGLQSFWEGLLGMVGLKK